MIRFTKCTQLRGITDAESSFSFLYPLAYILIYGYFASYLPSIERTKPYKFKSELRPPRLHLTIPSCSGCWGATPSLSPSPLVLLFPR